jgi:molybdate transport system substrate-binding protein
MISKTNVEGIMKEKTLRTSTIAAVTFALAVGFISLFAQKTPAQGAEIRVFTSDGMKAALEELTPQIERSIGRQLATQFDSSKALRDKIESEVPFDVAILTSDVVDDLVKQGKIAAGTRVEIARTGMGIGIRAGAPKPDIGTPEALKRTLVGAKSITFNPIGASAEHINAMFVRLGIAENVKPKLILDSQAGGPQTNVVAGKAELVITPIPEIKFFKGVDLVGPLPADFQSYITFSAGVATNSHNTDAAKELIKIVTGPSAAPALKAKGVEPR